MSETTDEGVAVVSALTKALVSRGVSPIDAEVVTRGVIALIDVWGEHAAKKAAAAGAQAAASITTADEAEASARTR